MKKHAILSALLALPVSLGAAAPALADTAGAAGRIVAVEHVDNDSDDYLAYRGRIYVDSGAGVLEQYRWGGVACANRDLDIDQQRMLQESMNAKKSAIVPYWKMGQGGIVCLVGFTLTSSVKLAPAVTK